MCEHRDPDMDFLDNMIAFYGPKSKEGVAAASIKKRLMRLEKDNEELSAGACIHKGWPRLSAGGNMYCPVSKVRAAMSTKLSARYERSDG